VGFKVMNHQDKMLLEIKMLDQGIIPNVDIRQNVESQLSLMDDASARKAKRKWRKLKKKAVRSLKLAKFQKITRVYEKFAVIKMLEKDIDT